jgi:transcriptional regulator with XRE-family HTH domain
MATSTEVQRVHREEIGKNLRELRFRRGLNQIELAAASGVGQDTISLLEAGKHDPRPSTLRKLASGLNAEIEELLYGPKVYAPS